MANSVTVAGEMFISEGSSTYLEPYQEDFLLISEINTPEECRSVIQHAFLNDRLKQKNPKYRAWNTCQIVEVKKSKEAPADEEFQKLIQTAVSNACLPENLSAYRSITGKMDALKRAVKKVIERKEEEEEAEEAAALLAKAKKSKKYAQAS